MEERQDVKKAARPSGDRSVFAQYFGERKYSIAYPPQNVKGQAKNSNLFCFGPSLHRFEAMLKERWLGWLLALHLACGFDERVFHECLTLAYRELGSASAVFGFCVHSNLALAGTQ